MAVLSHEGTYPILYGSTAVPVGASHRTGYLARPDQYGKAPTILVLPGLDGLGSGEKDLCRRLARAGFAALAVDLYGSKGDGLTLYNSMTDDDALSVVDEFQQFIASRDVEWNISDSLGVYGNDVGGRIALIKAATKPWVASLVLAYAPLTGDENREHQVANYLEHLPVPVLGLYGSEDDLISPETVDEAQRRNDHGQWLLYEGAGHDFLDIDSEGFDQAAADDAFARITAFFKATLPAPSFEDLG